MIHRLYSVARIAASVVLVATALLLVLRMVGVVSLYSVQSGSMWPNLPVGSLVVSVPREASNLKVGDIVTVEDGSGRVTHRVVATQQHDQLGPSYRLLTLRGDNNRVDDPQPYIVDRADMLIFHVPWIGSVIDWLSVGINRIAVIAGLVGCVLVRSGMRVHGKRRGPVSAAPTRTTVGAHAGVKASA